MPRTKPSDLIWECTRGALHSGGEGWVVDPIEFESDVLGRAI